MSCLLEINCSSFCEICSKLLTEFQEVRPKHREKMIKEVGTVVLGSSTDGSNAR